MTKYNLYFTDNTDRDADTEDNGQNIDTGTLVRDISALGVKIVGEDGHTGNGARTEDILNPVEFVADLVAAGLRDGGDRAVDVDGAGLDGGDADWLYVGGREGLH